MCYTPLASALLATGMIAVAAHEYRAFKCKHYSLGLCFIALMELLQVFQHFWVAVPEDDFAMCHNKVNVILTQLGGGHIAFQPFFLNWILQGLHRRYNLRDRIESDLITTLQFLGAMWMLGGGVIAQFWKPEGMAATPGCPDYQWLREGYDHALNFTTPNRYGAACTFYPPTKSGHLAWVLPQLKGSYYTASTSLHCFMMFACHLALFRTRPLIAVLSFVGFLTGPVLAYIITPSVNEQGAVWCFYSVIQMVCIVLLYRFWGVPEEEPPTSIEVTGKLGEKTLIYRFDEKATLAANTRKEDDNKRDNVEESLKKKLLEQK